jgi:hypothetical protein
VTVREQPTASMLIDRWLACGLCVKLALAVITIFILPSTRGPYSVVRGPATVFQVARAAARARTVVVQGPLCPVAAFPILPFLVIGIHDRSEHRVHTLGARECDPVLRC